jgi:hypothetical protein
MDSYPANGAANDPGETVTPTTNGETLQPQSADDLVASYRSILQTGQAELTDEQRAKLERIETQVRGMERASLVKDEERGDVDQPASKETIAASAVLFRERLRALAQVESDEDTRDLLLEIPKLMGEYLQTVTQHESSLVMANLLSDDLDTYQQRISNYARVRRGKHQALMTRINMAVRAARGHGIEPLIYREVSKEVNGTDRYTIADYSRNVLGLFS